MTPRTNQRNSQSKKLNDDSARVLTAFYRQKKQNDVAVQPYDEQILKLIDLLVATREQWKTERNLRIAAEEQVERMERGRTNLENQMKMKDTKILKLQEVVLGRENRQRFLEEQVDELKQKLESIRPLIEKTLKNTPDYDEMMKLTRMIKPSQPTPLIRRSRHIKFSLLDDNQTESDSASTANTEDEVHLRHNSNYHLRSPGHEPETSNQRVSSAKRTRTTRFDAIDEEQENEDPRIRAPSAKRSREQTPATESEVTTVTKITMNPYDLTPTRATVEVHRSKRRSVSASRVLEAMSSSARRHLIGQSPHFLSETSTSDFHRSPRTPTVIGKSWTRGRPFEDCTHRFESYKKSRLLTAIMQITCGYCNLSLTSVEKKAVSCTECQLIFHDRCKLFGSNAVHSIWCVSVGIVEQKRQIGTQRFGSKPIALYSRSSHSMHLCAGAKSNQNRRSLSYSRSF
ncbi:hypothetical protein M3Y94_00150000 [Aphelenchoides besseyi]|nr:hypothetical protein M3Y94_00150000 [Aphelenchoides besseyi]